MENEDSFNLKERIENLKVKLKENQRSLTVTEYNKKQAIFEYLKRLDNNGNGKVKASMEAAKLVFIESALHRAKTIYYWTNYWLQYNYLPISYQDKYQKIVHLIDDEDIVEKCHIWI